MDYSSGKGVIKKRRIRDFQNSWLDEVVFKGWLTPHPAENKALCIACNKAIRCCKTDLVQHSKTAKHIKSINLLNNNATNTINNDLSHKDKVKCAEIKLATFFAEHNIAFETADHLVALIKDVCTDPKVVQDLSLSRNKCANIVKNVIAKREVENIVQHLQTCPFSILIDESTDITDNKVMCLLVQYISPLNKKLTTQLLKLLPLDGTDCSATKIFEIFKNYLEEKEIPIKNIVGMACDNASVMIGCKNSFMSHLKKEVPNLVTLNCTCHSSALIASKACSKLPMSCENLIRGVATYISGSVKRCAILGEFQDFFEVQRSKMLKLSDTRWLSLHKCVIRILDNWEVLRSYFILATVEDKVKSAELILEYLTDNSIKAYMLFLKYVLHFFNTFNALFQSRDILIHKLYENSRQIIQQISQNFMNVDILKDFNVDVNNKDNLLNVENIYVGPECESFLVTLSSECSYEIKLKCLDFYITAVQEMLKRLPFNNTLFHQLTFLDPKIALYYDGRLKIKDLTFIAEQINYNRINIKQLAYEWQILPSYFSEEQKKELEWLKIDKMWKSILEFTNLDGEKLFPNLESLVEIVLSFPHSNAEAKRIFSIITDVKSKKRNRLNNDTVSSICVVQSSFQAKNINCTNFEIDSRHLELHNASNLYGEKCKSDST